MAEIAHVCQQTYTDLFYSGRLARKALNENTITKQAFQTIIDYLRLIVIGDLKCHPPQGTIAVVDRLTRPQAP